MSNDLSREQEHLLKAIAALGAEIERLGKDNKRLLGLLKAAMVYSCSMPTTLVEAIEREVGDE